MIIRIREIGNINVIDIEGQIDINASEIIETISWLLKNKKMNILLNFDKVDTVDYSGVSILAIAYQNVINNKGKMKFCNVPLPVDELFRLVRLDSIFEVYKDERDALTTFHFGSPIDQKLLRRRFKRLDAHIEIEFCLKAEYRNKNKIWHVGKLFNLSGDGIFLYSKKVLSVGDKVIVRINLRNERPMEIKGEIIWVADKKLQPQSYPGMGICFKNISKRNQNKILEFIDKHITHRSAIS